MKALPKKLLPLTFFAIAVTSLFSARPAEAGYIVTLQQVGSNVVATGSGAIDLTGLRFIGEGGFTAQMIPRLAIIDTGRTANVDLYTGFLGPASFGPRTQYTLASSSSGDMVGITGPNGFIAVPQAYVSGNALSDSSTYDNATFASLGVRPGTYEWTWGTGVHADSFTLQIGSVPDRGSTVSLLGCGLLGLAVLRRKLSC